MIVMAAGSAWAARLNIVSTGVMSKPKPKQKQRDRQQHHAKPRGRRKFFILIGFVLMVGIAVAVAVALLREANRGFDALNGRGISKFPVSSRSPAVLDQGPIYTCGSICLF